MPVSLPIDSVIPEIIEVLRHSPNVVVEAPPGAGKTTRVPPALLRAGGGEVLVLEPRRIAARLAARRVAQEMGEAVGETTGYHVRFEDVSGPRTRLRFLTEGVLTRRLLSDRELRGVGCVVLDEFHERHLDGDLALALLRRLQRTARPDLRIVVMSATLDGAAVSSYLDGCPIVRSEGRLYPIAASYTPLSGAPLGDRVLGALDKLLREGVTGDVLVFLPGAGEIRRAMRAAEPLAARHELLLLPLHGDLSPEEQDRAVAPASRRKVIFSTNVAESSVTIEGVTAVIDSGLARVARDSPWSGISSLDVARISRNSAVQRAGRAGRTAPGRVIRLYPEEDFLRRPEADSPEIRRRELSGVVLALHSMGLDAQDLPWFEAPPEASLAAARTLLERLGAYARERDLARIPLHPRLATLALEGGRDASLIAAAISSGERVDSADVFDFSERGAGPQTRRLADLLKRQVPARGDVHMALLRAFPDRVARRRDRNELLLAGGGSALLPEQAHGLVRHSFLIAIDVEERRERGLPLVRLAAAIEPEMLVEAFPERIEEKRGVEWNRAAERVECVAVVSYDGLAIEESRSGAVDSEEAARLLAAKAKEAGIGRFTDPDTLEEFLARCAFAAQFGGVAHPDVDAALETVCRGLRSFAELKRADFTATLMAQLSPRERAVLEAMAPERCRLASGRSARVRYARDKTPWLESRLQDFFGMQETPRVGGGRVPLVLHLLAPNQRPVQTTTDLAGFWEKWYPQVRRELSRRYPRHAWPEKPL